MQLRPRFDQSALTPGEFASNYLDRIDAEDSNGILIVGVEMRSVMWLAHFHEHPNDDAEKPTDLGHSTSLSL
jgi:hypothetical protein